MVDQFDFHTAFARRVPDPNFQKDGMERYVFLMRCKDMPLGVGNDPNARTTNTSRKVYKGIRDSLLNDDGSKEGTFHLKNKGITIIAESVEQVNSPTNKSGNKHFVVKIGNLHGIVDGGHTYQIITDNKKDAPDDQYVKVEILTKIPEDWITDIAGGLNTAVQVQQMSLFNRDGKFIWLKGITDPAGIKIGWTENDGEDFDISDVARILCVFNVEIFPNTDPQQPTKAYGNKNAALDLYDSRIATFKRMQGIVLDTLTLHDVIASTAKTKWNSIKRGNKGGSLKMIKSKKTFHPFIREEGDSRLIPAALYPILSAFRRFVVQKETTGEMHWITDFKNILDFWDKHAAEMLKTTYDKSVDLKNIMNALGKDSSHWKTLHASVGIRAHEEGILTPNKKA